MEKWHPDDFYKQRCKLRTFRHTNGTHLFGLSQSPSSRSGVVTCPGHCWGLCPQASFITADSVSRTTSQQGLFFSCRVCILSSSWGREAMMDALIRACAGSHCKLSMNHSAGVSLSKRTTLTHTAHLAILSDKESGAAGASHILIQRLMSEEHWYCSSSKKKDGLGQRLSNKFWGAT